MKQERVWWIWIGREYDTDKGNPDRLIPMGWVVEFWAVYALGEKPLYASGPVERYREGIPPGIEPSWPTREEVADGVAMPFSCHQAVLSTLSTRRDEFVVIPLGDPIPARILRRAKRALA